MDRSLSGGLLGLLALGIVAMMGEDQADPGFHGTFPGAGGDPRLHVFETVLREQGTDLVGKKDAKTEEITVVDTLKADAANP